jgi:hypothetical protein
MASTTPISPPLDPQLYEHWDDEDDLRWKAPLNALITHTQTPREAAQALDTMLRTDTSACLQKLLDYASTYSHELSDLDDYQRGWGDWGDVPAPNASGHVEMVMRWYARVCTAFGPYSEGQNRLVELLEELRTLPRWEGPESKPDEKGECSTNEYWAFGRSWLGIEDAFRREHAGRWSGLFCSYVVCGFRIFHMHLLQLHNLLTEKTGVAHDRWLNLQSTMARLTSRDLIYCAPWNALRDIVPAKEPKLHIKRSSDCDVVAAAQWVIWPDECRYVYKECMKKETTTHPHYWEPWCKQSWKVWKREFGYVVESELYDEETRSVARRALSRMEDTEEEVEKEGSVGSGSG